jgi:hypothetical protein
MLKRLVLGFGLALVAVAMAVAPVLAYYSTPGANCGTSNVTVVGSGTITFSAHFNGGAGQVVTFSATTSNPGTTVSFNPTTATTDVNGNVTTQVTFGGSPGNVNVAGSIGGVQYCGLTEAITALPAASYLPAGLPVPFAWMAVLLVGVGLVGAALLGRRRQPAV